MKKKAYMWNKEGKEHSRKTTTTRAETKGLFVSMQQNQKRRNFGSVWLPRRSNKVVCRKVCDFEIRNQNNTQSLCVGRFLDFKGTEIRSNTQGEKKRVSVV